MRLHWPKTDQFINDNIFTLINSKGSLYQRKGSPSPSLLGQHRSCAGQGGAGQGRRVRTVRTPKAAAEQAALRVWPLLRQECCLPWLLHSGMRLGGLALAMQGTVIRGNQAFSQYTECFLQATMLAGLAVLCIQQLKHQCEAVERDFFCMSTLYCSLSNWECGGAAN